LEDMKKDLVETALKEDIEELVKSSERTMISAKIRDDVLQEVKKGGLPTTRIIEAGLNHYLSLNQKQRQRWLVENTPEISSELSPEQMELVSELPGEEFNKFFQQAFNEYSKIVSSIATIAGAGVAGASLVGGLVAGALRNITNKKSD
jgi:post-segregation antitoxin (ccd killing protein)